MVKDSLKWYQKAGVPEVVLKRAEEITILIEKFYGIVIEDLFISNIVNEDSIEYTSLWLFTKEDVVECKHFLTRSDIDIARYGKNVTYINYLFDDFKSIETQGSSSNIKLNVSLGQGMKCILNAVGSNCERLIGIASRFMEEYKNTKI